MAVGAGEPVEVPLEGDLHGRFGLLAMSDPDRAVRVAFRNFRSLEPPAADVGDDKKD